MVTTPDGEVIDVIFEIAPLIVYLVVWLNGSAMASTLLGRAEKVRTGQVWLVEHELAVGVGGALDQGAGNST